MPLNLLIPMLMLVLSCTSTTAFAAKSHSGNGAHVHIHEHGGVVHQHIHAGHDPNNAPAPTRDCPESADDHHHCCGDHEHLPQKQGDGLTSRSRELPTFSACVCSSYFEASCAPGQRVCLRWKLLRQRPPDQLGYLRTCVMLN